MIITTHLLQHTEEENELMAKLVKKFMKIHSKASYLIASHKMKPEEFEKAFPGVTPPTPKPFTNVYAVAPKVKKEFTELLTQEKTIFNAIMTYEGWFAELERLTNSNPNPKSEVTFGHYLDVYSVCTIFQDDLNASNKLIPPNKKK